ncbi:MAG: peptidase S8, partial [Vulcanimicrobiaceae bacterium]
MTNYSRPLVIAVAAATVTLAACAGHGQNALIPAGNTQAAFALTRARSPMIVPVAVGDAVSLCPGIVAPGTANCMALVQNVRRGPKPLVVRPQASPTPIAGSYAPADLRSAYNVASAATADGKTQTIGIVDAYDDPNAEADLDVYRAYYHEPACTTANACFKKVSQTGTTAYPAANGGWAGEISVDLDMASAMCPNCKIVLVEATDNAFANLGAAENEAVTLGANVVSNSYGGNEWTEIDHNYWHHGHTIVASAGDSGYYAQAPASYSTVIAVGGTHLVKGGGTRGWTETAWSGSGSGCSQYTDEPPWQLAQTICPTRMIGDLSAVADP